MSFHFKIKKKQNISFKQLLENKYLPENTNISFEANFNELLNGYSKLYISKLSSRGVAITTTQNEFDVEVNVGATKEDWRLAVKISLALGELNDSLINPEFDDEKTLEQFENEYNEAWVESVKYHSMSIIIQMFKEDKTRGGAMTFMGCIRHFYVGNYVIDTLSKDNESEELLYDRLIEEIRKIQFIEDYEDEIEFPSTRIMDFPEGEKKIAIFPANFKVLLPKVDYVFLMKKNEAIVQVAYDDFIKYISTQSKRVDELQYIIYAVDESKHYNMLLHFKSLEDKKNEIKIESKIETITKLPTNKIEKIGTKKWWKFWK
ncbi:hypothetical protein [Epilithonimonas caeni]|uniref:hypothetical protein n=1 Tax=Epilithonimonas caeni TaxID=365343 RepID=UPI000412A475|nr:hypothetical protein [Epilithonimonas caeni]